MGEASPMLIPTFNRALHIHGCSTLEGRQN
jgi:hypothetical protein